MTSESAMHFFIRQCLYALGFFALVSILTEWVVPGSVSPFLDPVPVGIVALMLLCADAMMGE